MEMLGELDTAAPRGNTRANQTSSESDVSSERVKLEVDLQRMVVCRTVGKHVVHELSCTLPDQKKQPQSGSCLREKKVVYF